MSSTGIRFTAALTRNTAVRPVQQGGTAQLGQAMSHQRLRPLPGGALRCAVHILNAQWRTWVTGPLRVLRNGRGNSRGGQDHAARERRRRCAFSLPSRHRSPI